MRWLCAFDPEDRYQSAEELLRALNQVIRGKAPKAQAEPARAAWHSGEEIETQPIREKGAYETMPAKQSEKFVSPKQISAAEKKLVRMLVMLAILLVVLLSILAGIFFLENREDILMEAASGEANPDGTEAAILETAEPAEIPHLPTVTEETTPTEPTTAATEPEKQVPDRVTLVDGSWENGDVKVVALNEDTPWIQVTDSRWDEEFRQAGTTWQLCARFGEETKIETTDDSVHICYPFHFVLDSLAFSEMNPQDHGNNLRFYESTSTEDNPYAGKTLYKQSIGTLRKAVIHILPRLQCRNGSMYLFAKI